jgi:hypothetical protein
VLLSHSPWLPAHRLGHVWAILAAALVNLCFLTYLFGVMLESGLRHRHEAFQLQLRQFDTAEHALGPKVSA